MSAILKLGNAGTFLLGVGFCLAGIFLFGAKPHSLFFSAMFFAAGFLLPLRRQYLSIYAKIFLLTAAACLPPLWAIAGAGMNEPGLSIFGSWEGFFA